MTCELGCPKRAIYKGEERILVCSECYPRIEEALSEEARGVIQRLSDALEAADQRADQAEAELKDAYRTDIPSLKDQRDAAIKRAAELAAALEAAEQERDEARKAAEDHVLDADAVHVRLSAELREVNQERDALAAVVEKAEDYVTRHYLDTRFGDEVLPMLATVPDDVLREHDAALIEGLAEEIRHHQHAESIRQMLLGKARQRRGEKS